MFASTRRTRPFTSTISTVIFWAEATCVAVLGGAVFWEAEFCAVRDLDLDLALLGGLLGVEFCFASAGTVLVCCSAGLLASVGSLAFATTTGPEGLLASVGSVGFVRSEERRVGKECRL